MKIVFIGDSVTKGTDYNVAPDDTFGALFCSNFGDEFINAGVGSNTTSDVLNRLYVDVISANPDVCVLMIGHNDIATGVPFLESIENTRSIISNLKNNNIKPVLLSLNLARGSAEYLQSQLDYLVLLDHLAFSENVSYIDVWKDTLNRYVFSGTISDLYEDEIHHNTEGHLFLANILTNQANSDKIRSVTAPPESNGCQTLTKIIGVLATDGYI